jgi:hypothetical protein
MSYKASAWAVEQTVGDSTAKLLLLTLAESADIEYQQCWPGRKLLAQRIEASIDTVDRKLRFLESRGFIQITIRTRTDGSKTSNVYRINCPGVAAEPCGGVAAGCGQVAAEPRGQVAAGSPNAIYKEPVREPSLNHGAVAPKSKGKPEPEVFDIPESLKTSDFLTAWDDFVANRKALKKPVTRLAAVRLLKLCEQWGPVEAVESIDASIASNWSGLFPVKRQNGGRGTRPVELRGGNTPDNAPFFTPEMDAKWGARA